MSLSSSAAYRAGDSRLDNSILGVVLLSRADSKVGVLQYFVAPSPRIPKQALLGDVFALGAALTYAVYTVWLKARCGDERRIS